jgi:RNA polymerase-binding transcription factor DksA
MINLETARQILEARVVELGARVDEIEQDLRSPGSADFEEHAIEVEGNEVLEGLEGSALREIAQIRAALHRIDEGNYGNCVTCGNQIGERRLEAVPHTPQCIKCV